LAKVHLSITYSVNIAPEKVKSKQRSGQSKKLPGKKAVEQGI
jgi:hypothetical protein